MTDDQRRRLAAKGKILTRRLLAQVATIAMRHRQEDRDEEDELAIDPNDSDRLMSGTSKRARDITQLAQFARSAQFAQFALCV